MADGKRVKRGDKRRGGDPRSIPMGNGSIGRARNSILRRGMDIDSIVDHAVRGGNERQGSR